MPRKIQELEEDLRRACFVKHACKGNHRTWKPPKARVTVSGNPGDDVPDYLEKLARREIQKAKN